MGSSKAKKNATANGDERWVAIETLKEFCVVRITSILCLDLNELCVGDIVSFKWSKKEKLTGTIRIINGE